MGNKRKGKTSIVITLLNEEKSVEKLINSLLDQSLMADEIIIVDAGSTDKTVAVIKTIKSKKIKLFEVKNIKRASGRNFGVRKARNDIIAMTDGDCVAQKDWLERIVRPIVDSNVDISAGFYNIVTKTNFQQALAPYLGITPSRFSCSYLPSTRSIAFKKSIWEEIGGFPQDYDNSAEDTEFNYLAVKSGAKIIPVKSARVNWSIPKNPVDAVKKFYYYAKWDAKRGIFWHPTQKLKTHNLRAILVLVRYMLGLFILIFSYKLALLSLFFYSTWVLYKHNKEAKTYKVKLILPLVQVMADLAVILGFIKGIYEIYFQTQ